MDIKVGLAFVGGAAIGAAVSWKVVSIRLNEQYSAIVEHEMTTAKAFYERVYKVGDFETPSTASETLKAASDAMLTYNGIPIDPEVKEFASDLTDDEIVEYFSEEDPEKNTEDEDTEVTLLRTLMLTRDPNKPYLITFSEFEEGRTDKGNQNTITWYEEDGVLADERDQMINNVDKVVGLDNLSKFGMNVDDPNIVYVRNDNLGCDFEILRETGSYAVMVHGFDEPPVKRKTPKMSRFDD